MDIYIENKGAHNIYHFIMYMLCGLRNYNGFPKNIYIDISNPYFISNHNFVIEALNILYPDSKIHNVQVQPLNTIAITEKLFKDPPINLQVDVETRYPCYYFIIKSFINNVITYDLNNKYSKYIYISRYDSKYRRIKNEELVMDYLNTNGFSKIQLTNMPLIEQFAIFYNAEIIISVHGAALTNILFCKPNTKVIEISCNFLKDKTYFEDIANCLNLIYYKFTDTESINNSFCPNNEMAKDIIVNNIESISKYL